MSGGAPDVGGGPREAGGAALVEVLTRTEAHLDPADPEAGGRVRVLGYGEVSVALTVAELPGRVCKRMSGFAGDAAAQSYVQLVEEYLAELGAGGVRVAATEPVIVPRAGVAPVVYLVQPELPPASLGSALLHTATDKGFVDVLHHVLAQVAGLARHTAARREGVEVALDGQLSNWSFGVAGDVDGGEPGEPDSGPVLIDVGTPFMRRWGRHAIDQEFLLAPVPAGIRAYYRRRRLIGAYLDDYFVPRLVAVDLLGNFHKEGRPDRVPMATREVNAWLDSGEVPGPRDRVTVAEVEHYYRQDADLLALYLRLRRMDRVLRTRVRRGRYDYVLPGAVQR